MDSIFDYISPKIYIVCLSFGQCVVFPRFMDILPILSYPPVFVIRIPFIPGFHLENHGLSMDFSNI